MLYDPLNKDTIVALATPEGSGALGLIRISGIGAFSLADKFYVKKNSNKKIADLQSHTIHLGRIESNDSIVDEVLLSVFRGPNSYSGEDTIEISCHGSRYIQQQIIFLALKFGARLANPGEFTLRAFFNKRLDLVQAEAVADLIGATSATSHQNAIKQMRGGFSSKLKLLRENLVNFASLIELELDFSEEDVEFANKGDLKILIEKIYKLIIRLIESFELGNVIKNGIQVAIVGRPNAGKSTLLNLLLNEERAIVSEIPGTTRDTIEDELSIGGVLFRFIDTAGIRETMDTIEQIGVAKTFEKINSSSIIIYLFDIHELTSSGLKQELEKIEKHLSVNSQLLLVGNKIDKEDINYTEQEFKDFKDIIFVSAKGKLNIEALKHKLIELFDNRTVNMTETVVTNARHVQALNHAASALERVLDGLENNLSGELLAVEIKDTLNQLGMITGEVTNEELLENIFSRFCIGK